MQSAGCFGMVFGVLASIGLTLYAIVSVIV